MTQSEKTHIYDLRLIHDFDGIVLYSPFYYGYYTSFVDEKSNPEESTNDKTTHKSSYQYNLPLGCVSYSLIHETCNLFWLYRLIERDCCSRKWNHKAYFLSTLIVLLFSFTAILRAIAGSADQTENLLDDDDLRFSIQIFSCWDYKIANQETADIKIASIATSIREAILEDQERGRKQEQNSWSTRILRILGSEFTTHKLWVINDDS